MHLIIGADSHIGENLFSYWVERGVFVEGTSRRQSCNGHLYLDLLDVSRFEVPNYEIDSVVVLAGITDVGYCDLNKKVAQQINVKAIKQLIEKLRPRTKYFLFLSSNLVFDGEKTHYTVEDTANPLTEYGKNKVCIEEFIFDKNLGGVLRLDKIVDFTKPLFRNWKASLLKQQPVEAYCDLYFSPVEIMSVVRKIDNLVLYKKSEISHLPGKGLTSYYDYVCSMAIELGVSTELVYPVKSGLQNRAKVCLC